MKDRGRERDGELGETVSEEDDREKDGGRREGA